MLNNIYGALSNTLSRGGPCFVCSLLELASVTIALWGFPRAGAMEELDGGEGVAQLR